MRCLGTVALVLVVLLGTVEAVEWPGRLAWVESQLAAEDESRQLAAIQELGGLDDPRADVLLRELLEHPNPAFVAEALRAASQDGSRDLVDAVTPLLASPHPEIRAAAATSLGALGHRGHVQIVARLLTDSEEAVRLATVGALVALGSPDAVPTLIGALDDRDADVVEEALRALEQLNHPAALHPILEQLSAPNPDVRVAALRALIALDRPEAVGSVATLARSNNVAVSVAAIDALGRLAERGDPRVVAALLGHFARSDGADRRLAAREALVRVVDGTSLRALRPHFEREPAALAPVLAAIGPPAWPALRARFVPIVASTATDSQLVAWLKSGDPEAVDFAITNHRGDGIVDVGGLEPALVDLLAAAESAYALCRGAEVENEAVVGRIVRTLVPLLREEQLPPPCLRRLAQAVQSRAEPTEKRELALLVGAALLRADDSSGAELVMGYADSLDLDEDPLRELLAASSTGNAALPVLRAMLRADDRRLVREASYLLASRGDWLDEAPHDVVAGVLSGPVAGWKAITTWYRQAPDATVVTRTLATHATTGSAQERAEALALLSTRCDPAALPTAAVNEDHHDYWVRRAAAGLIATCFGSGNLTLTPTLVADPQIRALTTSQSSTTELSSTTLNDAADDIERIAAIAELSQRDPETARRLADQLASRSRPAVSAAAWATLHRLGSPSERPREELAVYARTAEHVAERAVLRWVLGQIEGEELPRTRFVAPDDPPGVELVFVVEPESWSPRRDVPVFFVGADGAPGMTRTDAEGRVLWVGERPALFVVDPGGR